MTIKETILMSQVVKAAGFDLDYRGMTDNGRVKIAITNYKDGVELTIAEAEISETTFQLLWRAIYES